jgi:hypothetical protein
LYCIAEVYDTIKQKQTKIKMVVENSSIIFYSLIYKRAYLVDQYNLDFTLLGVS